MGAPRRQRRRGLRAALRRRPAEEEGRHRASRRSCKDADELLLATDEDREGEAIAWHLRRGAEAEGAGAADGLPRDHAAGDRAGARRDARDRRAARRRAGDAPHPRPALRLRGLAGALAEGDAGALGRPRAVGRDAARRRARARADGVRRRRATGTSSATFDPAAVHGAARRRRRAARRPGPRLRPATASSAPSDAVQLDEADGARARRRRSTGAAFAVALGRAEAVHAPRRPRRS